MTNRNEEPIQPGLFQDNVTDQPTIDFPVVSDIERDSLLVSIMALKSIKGVGFRTIRSLFDARFLHHLSQWDAEEIARQWSSLSNQYRVDLDKAVFSKKESILEVGLKSADDLKSKQIWFVPIGHKDYPSSLHRLSDSPRWIFGTGSLEAVQSNSIIAVVGTRTASQIGQTLAYSCATELVRRNVVVLAGLAKGIDEKAHLGATDHYGQSIGVLGHGITASDDSSNQMLWSRIIETDGSVISEYLPTDPPSRKSFLRRNELQAALSKVVIPIECPSMESGTGATIRRAMFIGTPVVGVFPGQGEEKALLLTKDNLSRLNIPVFTVMSDNSGEFWKHLKKIMPEHDWQANPKARQDRFFKFIERQVLSAKKKINLDDQAIDRFADRLKHMLKG